MLEMPAMSEHPKDAEVTRMDLERIVIYPRDYDQRTRLQLLQLLQRLDIRYECGYWG